MDSPEKKDTVSAEPEPELTETDDETEEYEETEEDKTDEYEDDETIRCKWVGDGSKTLDELIERLNGFAEYVRHLKQEGWELIETMDDDWGFIRQNPEAKARAKADAAAKVAAPTST